MAEPLKNTQKVIMMTGTGAGPSTMVNEATLALGQLSTVIEGITGLNISELVKGTLTEPATKKKNGQKKKKGQAIEVAVE